MSGLQLYAVTKEGVARLPLPVGATSFDNLYDGFPVGVYSAFRTYQHNRFLGLEAHLERTERSMALLGWQEPLDRTAVCRALHDVCTAFPAEELRVRLDVLADKRVLLALMPLTAVPPAYYEQGVAVGLAEGLSRQRPLVKGADFALARKNYLALHPSERYEQLLLDEAGRILEGVSSNFYGVRDGVVWTAGEGVLEGITRKLILELLPELGIPLRLEAVAVADLPLLQEAGISSASRALVPVVQVGEQVIGDGRPGPICRRILAAYNERVGQLVKKAVDSG